MRRIALTKGMFTLVDDEDFDYLNQWKWFYHTGYAVRNRPKLNGKRGAIYMHRVVNNTPPEKLTDHINQNKLDNRKNNLRSCNTTQNQHNKDPQSNNRSGFKGVSRHTHRWQAYIYKNKSQIYLGLFDTVEGAAEAYNTAAIKLQGEFAKLNKVSQQRKVI